MHTQRRLDQSGDTGRGFRMAQVGFHRPHPAGPFRLAALAQHLAQGPQLDRITLTGTGAMGLHVLGGGRVETGTGKRGAHAGDLGPQVGGHHAVAAAVGVHGRAMDQGIDRIPIGLGRSEGFEQHRPGALRARVTIGGGIEALAAAIGSQQPRLAEVHLDAGVN